MGPLITAPEDRSTLAHKLGLSGQDDTPLLARLVPSVTTKNVPKTNGGSRTEAPRPDTNTKKNTQSLSDEQIAFAKIESKLEAIRQVDC